MFKEVSIPHMLYGGTAFFFYTFTFDVLRHHAETNLRPKIVDHTLALGILGATTGALTGNGSLRRIVQGGMFFTLTIAPMTWWLKLQGTTMGSYHKPVNMFYQNDVTPDEVARYQAMD